MLLVLLLLLLLLLLQVVRLLWLLLPRLLGMASGAPLPWRLFPAAAIKTAAVSCCCLLIAPVIPLLQVSGCDAC